MQVSRNNTYLSNIQPVFKTTKKIGGAISGAYDFGCVSVIGIGVLAYV